MNAEPDKTAGGEAPPASPPRDPNYILSQEEFHEVLGAHADYHVASERRLHRHVESEVDALRETAGWIALSFAFWLLLVAGALICGYDRGRPDRV